MVFNEVFPFVIVLFSFNLVCKKIFFMCYQTVLHFLQILWLFVERWIKFYLNMPWICFNKLYEGILKTKPQLFLYARAWEIDSTGCRRNFFLLWNVYNFYCNITILNESMFHFSKNTNFYWFIYTVKRMKSLASFSIPSSKSSNFSYHMLWYFQI